jgi:hypothetical protein
VDDETFPQGILKKIVSPHPSSSPTTLPPLKFVKKNVDCGTTCKKEGTICTNSSNEREDEPKEARLELMLQNTHTHTHTHTKCITLLVGTPNPIL